MSDSLTSILNALTGRWFPDFGEKTPEEEASDRLCFVAGNECVH